MSAVEDMGGPMPAPGETRRITVGGYQPLTAGNVNPPKDEGGAFATAITDSLKVAIPPAAPAQVRLRKWTVFARDTWASASTEFNREGVRYFDANTSKEDVRIQVARRMARKIEDIVIEGEEFAIMA